MKYLSEVFGLITKADPITENGGLFLAHYLTLKLMVGTPNYFQDQIYFYEKMYRARVSQGLYRRSERHQIRTVSHDEITGMIVGSHVLKTFHRDDIMGYLEKNLGFYPATGEIKFYRPSNYYAWGMLSERSWTSIFFPMYFANFLVAINKDKQQTSSKLIYLTELYHMKDLSPLANYMWKLFKVQMSSQYGERWIEALYNIYFHSEDEDHPLKYLPKQIDYDKL